MMQDTGCRMQDSWFITCIVNHASCIIYISDCSFSFRTTVATFSSRFPLRISRWPRGAGGKILTTFVGEPFRPHLFSSAPMSPALQPDTLRPFAFILPLSDGSLG